VERSLEKLTKLEERIEIDPTQNIFFFLKSFSMTWTNATNQNTICHIVKSTTLLTFLYIRIKSLQYEVHRMSSTYLLSIEYHLSGIFCKGQNEWIPVKCYLTWKIYNYSYITHGKISSCIWKAPYIHESLEGRNFFFYSSRMSKFLTG